MGVLVFDAKTGGVTSVNREARRIVNDLCAPGGSAEQLLEVLTFRRADGREVSLEEFPLAQGLSTGETVRAEEIVLQAPDGRSGDHPDQRHVHPLGGGGGRVGGA